MIIPLLEIGSDTTHRDLDARDWGVSPEDPFADWEDSMIAYGIGEDGERS